MTNSQIQQQALENATAQNSFSNYDVIFEGFIKKGLSENEIIPRKNVFTYNAWKALNRQVKKGEHGVKIVTWIPCTKKDKKTGKKESYRRPKNTTVFHISKTEEMNAKKEKCDGCHEEFKSNELENLQGSKEKFCPDCIADAAEELENYEEFLSNQD